jgi:hypothetical protein
VYRFCSVVMFSLAITSCMGSGPGKTLYEEDTEDRYVLVREGHPGHVYSIGATVKQRPVLHPSNTARNPKLRFAEINGDLDFIADEILGDDQRFVVESTNTRSYQVTYQLGDRDALKVVATALGLVVTREEREISAIGVREAPGGHRLKPAPPGEPIDLKQVYLRNDTWPLEGATMDDLARFLEMRLRRPVVNLTSLERRWSIPLSDRAAKSRPSAQETLPLDDTGLELRWEKVKVLVTVLKDQPKGS